MDADFWRKRWATNNIVFHEKDGNKLLARHFDVIEMPEGARYFLPLCGKTRDISRLLGKGYRVVGIELAELAIQQLFAELGIELAISQTGELKCYSGDNLDIFVGDFFALTLDMLGAVDAVYDRAALVALPAEMRPGYAAHLAEITNHAKQMLIVFEYNQSDMDGPPFNVDSDEVQSLYAEAYDIELIRCIDIPGGLKGLVKANEVVWLLTEK